MRRAGLEPRVRLMHIKPLGQERAQRAERLGRDADGGPAVAPLPLSVAALTR
jgi:hypothetical protein